MSKQIANSERKEKIRFVVVVIGKHATSNSRRLQWGNEQQTCIMITMAERMMPLVHTKYSAGFGIWIGCMGLLQSATRSHWTQFTKLRVDKSEEGSVLLIQIMSAKFLQ